MSMNLEQCIAANLSWSHLPVKLRAQLHDDPKEYEHQIVTYSLQNQLRYGGNLIQQILRREKKYYEKLIEHSQREHLLYPYHLQDKIVPGLRVTPFIYYRDLLIQVVRAERSYDCLPNFTAADCLRLLGIGRNQYIEVVNTYKSFLTTAGPDDSNTLFEILYDILPQQPVDTVTFEPWYVVRIGSVLLDDIEKSSDAERELIDRIIDAEQNPVSYHSPGIKVKDADLFILKRLFQRGLVYIEVPVDSTDRISVPTLEGFVMNRLNGDSRENLLYKIFVSVDENTAIGELAECLQIDVNLVAQAASLFCRLGFAYKRSDDITNFVTSNGCTTEDPDLLISLNSIDPAPASAVNSSNGADPDVSPSTSRGAKKLAFIFDSTVTAYLMMGNLSAGLKPHAVTMFEVGKLCDDSLESFLTELDNLTSIDEGEAKLYYEHAINLREALHFLRSQANLASTDFRGIDLVRGGSLLSLEPETRVRILQKHYNLVLSISPLTYEDRQAFSALWPAHIGPPVPEASSPWFRLFVSFLASGGSSNADQLKNLSSHVLPVMLLTRGAKLAQLPEGFLDCSRFLLTVWGHDPVVLSPSALLTTVNDVVLSSPVLIQATHVHLDGPRLYVRYIPLPLSRNLIEVDGDKTNPVPLFLTHLSKFIDLTSLCGYITVLAPLAQSDSQCSGDGCVDEPPDMDYFEASSLLPGSILPQPEQEPDSHTCVLNDAELVDLVKRDQPIYFITLHLGLPIFNCDILRAVCDRITTRSPNLLTPEARPQLEAANKQLLFCLDEFIYKTCSACWPTSYQPQRHAPGSTITNNGSFDQIPGPWPLPTRSILCGLGDAIVLL